jgi:hypothetical protein
MNLAPAAKPGANFHNYFGFQRFRTNRRDKKPSFLRIELAFNFVLHRLIISKHMRLSIRIFDWQAPKSPQLCMIHEPSHRQRLSG